MINVLREREFPKMKHIITLRGFPIDMILLAIWFEVSIELTNVIGTATRLLYRSLLSLIMSVNFE